MPYTLGEAAKATGKDRATISRAIKKGRISAVKNDSGEWQIEPVELDRVYPITQHATGADNRQRNDAQQGEQQDASPVSTSEIAALKAKLEMIEQERERERQQLTDQIEDLRRRLSQESEERRKLTALLTDQRPPAEQARKEAEKPAGGFWRRLVGGGTRTG